VKDLRGAAGELPQRHFATPVRLEIAENMTRDEGLPAVEFGSSPEDLYAVAGPVNLVRLMSIPEEVNRPDLE